MLYFSLPDVLSLIEKSPLLYILYFPPPRHAVAAGELDAALYFTLLPLVMMLLTGFSAALYTLFSSPQACCHLPGTPCCSMPYSPPR